MTHAGYATLPGLRWSQLAHLRTSPLAYRHALTHPRADTASLAIGRATHLLCLQPDRLHEEIAVWSGGRRAGREWEAYQVEHAGLEIVRAEDLAEAEAMATAVRAHQLVAPLLIGAACEVPLTWMEGGRRMKARPDAVQGRTLIELKTARTIEARQLRSQCYRLGYHCQLAHYATGYEAVHGHAPERVVIVGVEKDPPHDVAVYELLADGALYAGREERAELLDRLTECERTDSWPGRYPEVQRLDLPAWAFAEDDDAR